jgi:hypothetical protein
MRAFRSIQCRLGIGIYEMKDVGLNVLPQTIQSVAPSIVAWVFWIAGKTRNLVNLLFISVIEYSYRSFLLVTG